jgi:glutathione peroxidase-family protein
VAPCKGQNRMVDVGKVMNTSSECFFSPNFKDAVELSKYFRETGTLVIGPAGKLLQDKVWNEVIDLLKLEVPDLARLSSS